MQRGELKAIFFYWHHLFLAASDLMGSQGIQDGINVVFFCWLVTLDCFHGGLELKLQDESAAAADAGLWRIPFFGRNQSVFTFTSSQ